MYKYKKQAINRFGKNYIDKGEELIFKCDKCSRNKLYVNVTNGVYHCFRCGQKGRLIGRLSLLDIKNKYNNDLKDKNIKNKEMVLIPFIRKELTDKQREALKKRGLTDSDIEFYNICGRYEDDRIQIPNYIKGCLTDVICNWEYDKIKITSKNPKYLNSKEAEKGDTLFNYFNIEKGINQIILTEGIFNAIIAGRNAVASYGCNITERQCKLLIAKEPKSIVIAYDSDKPGVDGSCKVINYLANLGYKGIVKYILLPKGQDINDLGHDNFIKYCKENIVTVDLKSPMSKVLPKLLYDNKV